MVCRFFRFVCVSVVLRRSYLPGLKATPSKGGIGSGPGASEIVRSKMPIFYIQSQTHLSDSGKNSQVLQHALRYSRKFAVPTHETRS